MRNAAAQHQSPTDQIDFQQTGQILAQRLVAHKNAEHYAHNDQLGRDVEYEGENVDAQHNELKNAHFFVV
jgi:hypothetical protein